MGLGSVIETRRQQWLGELESVKADMGLSLKGQAPSPVKVENVFSWQTLCQAPAVVANQDEAVSHLAVAS